MMAMALALALALAMAMAMALGFKQMTASNQIIINAKSGERLYVETRIDGGVFQGTEIPVTDMTVSDVLDILESDENIFAVKRICLETGTIFDLQDDLADHFVTEIHNGLIEEGSYIPLYIADHVDVMEAMEFDEESSSGDDYHDRCNDALLGV